MVNVANRATALFDKVLSLYGKNITFYFTTEQIDIYHPKSSTRTSTTVVLKCLVHYSTDKDASVSAPAGLLETENMVITVKAADFSTYNLKNATFFSFEGRLYKITKNLPAIGFGTPTDRYYIYGEKSKEL